MGGLVDCHNYFGDKEKVFQITSIDDNIYYLKETSGSQREIVIPSFVLQDFVDKKMWTKVNTASATPVDQEEYKKILDIIENLHP